MEETGQSWRDPKAVGLLIWGALVALAGYPPVGIWPLALLGPAPLWALAAGSASDKKAATYGYAYGLGFFSCLVYWLVHTLATFGNLPLPAALAVFLLLILYLAIYPSLAAVYVAKVARKNVSLALALAPVAWVGLDWLRSWLFTGFGWGDMPQALWQVGWALDLAPIYGVWVIYLILAFLCVLPAFIIAAVIGLRPKGYALLPVAVAAVAMAVSGLLAPDDQVETRTARVAVIQGNIEQDKKWDSAYVDETLKRYRQLTLDALGGQEVDFILWPETAVPFLVRGKSRKLDALESVVARVDQPLIFGAPTRLIKDGQRQNRNSLYMMEPSGRIVERYDKLHLVPFGEYVPFEKILFFVRQLVVSAGNFTPGEALIRFGAGPNNVSVGPLICFEGIFSKYALEHVDKGAQLLALVTNDAWFGDTSAPTQHLAYGAWRAAETGLPLVRAANTGISAAFDARGRLIKATELNEKAGFVVEVEYPLSRATLAHNWQYAGQASLALALVALFVILRHRTRRNFKYKF